MTIRRLAALLLLPLALARVLAAAPAQPAHLPKIKVQDLHYGDVLFQFYTGDEFEALTRLEAYDHWGRMPNHRADAELLLKALAFVDSFGSKGNTANAWPGSRNVFEGKV